MNNKVLCVAMSTVIALAATSCGQKAPDIAGKYESEIAVSGGRSDIGISDFDSSLPVYLVVGKDNTFSIDLGFKELKKDLNKKADDIERGSVYIVKDITVTGTDHYEGTVEYKDGQFVFTGDLSFVATYEDGTLSADNLFGEKNLEFK